MDGGRAAGVGGVAWQWVAFQARELMSNHFEECP